MRNKFVAICTTICLLATSVPLTAVDSIMTTKARTDKLNFGELSDVAMKKTATSMMMWGLMIFPVAIAILALAIQPSVADSSSTTTSP